MFAGPNGSGKTSIYNQAKSEFSTSIFVNADVIERQLVEGLCFDHFDLKIKLEELNQFLESSNFFISKFAAFHGFPHNPEKLEIVDNTLRVKDEKYINSYFAADLAEFIRQKLLSKEISFVFETVMSHASKLKFLEKARDHGYRVYLYYVATEAPEINVQRVKQRVLESGHDVPENKIIDRYFKSLQLLKDAIKLSNRAFLFDTSDLNERDNLFAEITEGSKVELFFNPEHSPAWFYKYVVESSSEKK